MREDGDASDKPLDIAVLTRMKQFRAMNKLKKVALKVSCLILLNMLQFFFLFIIFSIEDDLKSKRQGEMICYQLKHKSKRKILQAGKLENIHLLC